MGRAVVLAAVLTGWFPCILCAESISVLAPNGGEVLVSGSSYEIVWDSNGAIANVLIEYSGDNGAEWYDVNTIANVGSYVWTVPAENSQECLVRVSDANDPDANDISDSCFTVYVCQLTTKADLNGDCKVDFKDVAIAATDWLRNGNPFDANYTEAPAGMAFIAGGTFQMGDSVSEGDLDERPTHTVALDSFFIGKYEVTNSEYCLYLNSAIGHSIYVSNGAVYGNGQKLYCDTYASSTYSLINYSGGVFGARAKGGRNTATDPMEMVSWQGAVAYCNWLSQQKGRQPCYNVSTWVCDFGKNGYHLATEAQWEYAARGGLSGKRFPWGDTITHSQANYWSYWSGGHPYYFYDLTPTEGYHPIWNDGMDPYSSPVGSFAANGYGLYDMAGDVWEWCNDWYSSTYYSSSPVGNPAGPTSGEYRVLRGGGWGYVPRSCRVAERSYGRQNHRTNRPGFRVVLDLQ